MWIVNEDGFFSVTAGNPDDYRKLNASSDQVVVRARDYVSLARMQEKLDWRKEHKIVGPWPDADYRYRMAMSKDSFAKYLSEYVMDDLDYVSFKGAMKTRWQFLPKRIQHAREVALIDIWAAAHASWSPAGWEDYPLDHEWDETVTESSSNVTSP